MKPMNIKKEDKMKYIVLIGRVLYCTIFLSAVSNHFSTAGVQYAERQGVPMPAILVPLAGVIALVGAVCVLFGYKAKFGAWLLVIFLVPVTLMMHNFWAVSDPMMARMQMAMFMKNISMLGGAVLITYFGSGTLSIDAYAGKPSD